MGWAGKEGPPGSSCHGRGGRLLLGRPRAPPGFARLRPPNRREGRSCPPLTPAASLLALRPSLPEQAVVPPGDPPCAEGSLGKVGAASEVQNGAKPWPPRQLEAKRECQGGGGGRPGYSWN